MPQWIHDRADHIRAKNPGMDKSMSFAIATQQAYAAGKAPKKDFGTTEGKRTALRKYDEGRKNYKKTADPKTSTKTAGIDLATVLGFSDELAKVASNLGEMQKMVNKSMKSKPGNVSKLSKPEAPVPSPDHLSSTKTNPPPPITAGGF